MTSTVINVTSMDMQVKTTLEKWAARKDVLSDAQAIDPELEMVAVHRWFQRNSVPGKYWAALAKGAKKRGLKVTVADIANAHSDSVRASA